MKLKALIYGITIVYCHGLMQYRPYYLLQSLPSHQGNYISKLDYLKLLLRQLTNNIDLNRKQNLD